MATTISVADDVYEWMKRRKKDKSFSEFIREMMEETNFKELEDIGFSESWSEVEETVEEASEKSWERIGAGYE